MKKPLWILVAALAVPAVTCLGQQSGMSNGNRPTYQGQTSQDNNHAMQTGSPNDNGAGLQGDYGKTQPGSKVKHKHHRHKSKTHKQHYEKNQSESRPTGEAQPQPQ